MTRFQRRNKLVQVRNASVLWEYHGIRYQVGKYITAGPCAKPGIA